MTYNLIILYSGGLDSYIANKYAKMLGLSPMLLYVDLGHPYANWEKKQLPKEVVVIEAKLYDHIKHRLQNQIIPSRNLLLATIASMFGNRIWIGALKGEQKGKEHDKSDRFFLQASDLLTYTNNFFQAKTTVETPFRNHTKAQIIEWALNIAGCSPEELLKTRSCYSPRPKGCGRCLTCVKRHIAFALNGINDGNRELVLKSDYYKELCEEIPKARKAGDYSRFDQDRIAEFAQFREIIKNS